MTDFFINLVFAFIVGGGLCVVAQLLLDLTKLTPARILTSYVVAGVLLGAIGLYEPIVEFAGCGATVPLTGFGWLLSKGVREAVAEEGLTGVLTGGITATAGGIATALILGWLIALIFKSKPKL